MRFRKVRFGALSIDDWELSDGQTWCLLGGNASGKSQLAALAAGERDPEEGCITERPERARLVSFEEEQARYERELKNDDTDYLDRIDAGTTRWVWMCLRMRSRLGSGMGTMPTLGSMVANG